MFSFAQIAVILLLSKLNIESEKIILQKLLTLVSYLRMWHKKRMFSIKSKRIFIKDWFVSEDSKFRSARFY